MCRIAATVQSYRKRLPSHLTCCWAIVGAAIGCSAMYCNSAYYSEGQDGFLWYDHTDEQFRQVMDRFGETVWSEGVVRILGFTVYREQTGRGIATRIVAQWDLAVTLVTGLLGATLAVLFSRRWRKPLQAAPFDLRLWVVVTSVLFVLLFWIGLPGERHSMFKYVQGAIRFYGGHLRDMVWEDEIEWLLRNSIRIWIPAVLVGWTLHVILVNFGIRLRRRLPDEAVDYDDRIKPTDMSSVP
jgi:hypothetical protein